jgi:hypothetical protein
MAVVPLRKKDDVHLIEPGGPSPHGVSIEEPDSTDEDEPDFVDQKEMPDGSLQISFGKKDDDDDDDPKPDDKFDRNLADGIDDFELNGLASTLLQSIESDEESRADWEDTANMAAAYLGVKLEDPTTSVSADGTVCKSIATCMLEAALKMWGVARAELLPVTGPVKVRQDAPPQPSQQQEAQGAQSDAADPAGSPTAQATQPPGGIAAPPPAPQGIAAPQPPPQPTPSGDKDKLARALEVDMNHYLTVVDKPYYPDTAQMLMHRDIIGLGFKKVYRDPLLKRPVSRYVKAQNLIIQNNVSHLDESGRRTERIPTTRATMRRLMVAGHYRDIKLMHPTARPSKTEMAVEEAEGVAAVSSLPQDYEHTVYECYCELGSGTSDDDALSGDMSRLDKDETGKRPGYPLPYRISIDVDSRAILEIRRNWRKGDRDHRPRRRYVKFGLIPGLGYYNWGLIHIVGNPTQSATMIQRAMVDSAIFSNFPGGVYLQGAGTGNMNSVFRPNPGEWLPVKSGGATKISDIFMPMPYKPPTPEVMALVEKLEGDVKRLSGVVEIPVGEGRLGNTPVGTIMSYIESVSQVPGAVHKDDHIAQQEEFELLRDLFAEDPESLTRGVRRPSRKWQIAEEVMEPELVPAADPNTPSEVHRLLKVQGLVTLGGLPQFQGIADQRAIYRFAAEALTGERAEEFTMPPQGQPQMPPDPRLAAAQIKAQADLQKAQMQQQTEGLKHQERIQEIQQEGEQREQDRQSAETRAAMSLEGAKIKAAHDTMNAHLDRQHEAGQQAQQLQHEAGQQQAEQQHEATQQAGQQQHEQAIGAQQQQHEAAQAGADRQQADTHKAADMAHEAAMGGAVDQSKRDMAHDEAIQETAENQADRQQADEHKRMDVKQAARGAAIEASNAAADRKAKVQIAKVKGSTAKKKG